MDNRGAQGQWDCFRNCALQPQALHSHTKASYCNSSPAFSWGSNIHDAADQSTYLQKDQRCQDYEFGFEVSSMEYTQFQIPYLTNAERWAATY